MSQIQPLREPQMLEFTKDLTLAVANLYEYTMAEANLLEGIQGKQAVFDIVVRRMPTNKNVGSFEHEGVKYDKLAQRDFLINCGLEQCLAYFLEGQGNRKLREYMEQTQGISNENFLNWVEKIKFAGDVYAMPEGTVFFAQEQQMRVHERFEEAQVFESLLLDTLNSQTNVCTTANDIAEVTNKILLEGGSHRATSPQSAIFNSRAARCGGFTLSSHVAYGMFYHEKVGGTHGHSYVMLHPSEYAAFKAQAKLFKNKVCFLLDTYNMKEALETALQIVQEEGLEKFAFRIDSGNLLEQAKYIHQVMKERKFEREEYLLVASDDLTASKIAHLEKEGADIDKYLAGTFVVNPPKPVTAVYKLAAFMESDGTWNLRGKLSEEFSKATFPGIKQVYRVTGRDGYYQRDIIAFEGEGLSQYLKEGESAEGLLIPVISQGKLIYDCPSIVEISRRRVEQLAKFKDIAHYQVIVSQGILEKQQEIMREHGIRK
ncbi:hypothetical protein HYX13_02920 [Candidatus Woesearchaeota archaeon]|nr:hypothetical protein [Candidatus Woesearchaeota archaeon]